MEKRPFSELGLSPEILKAVDKMGFEEASPIQTAVIPLLLQGRDVVGQSATGSGKTAAFAIPAIERVVPSDRSVQALILCPTRELATQVAEEFGKLAHFKRGVHSVPIYGGQSYERQFRALEAGAQIVIGTPGRVIDLIQRGALRLDSLKLLALDEADRMLDLGFREDIALILESTPASRQLLFFSATMPSAIQELIQRHSHEPEWVRIESVAHNAPAVEQIFFEVDRRYKAELLTRLIDLHDFRYGIIFCSTKVMVDELEEHLHSRGYNTDRLHGDISQAQRDRVMAKFRQRGFEFLVATDVAARGLDVDDLEVVFNYDLPNDAEDYTHRIGRTGRAGRSGMAFTFVAGRELYKFQQMVRYARLTVRRERVPTLDEVDEARENAFVAKIRAVLRDDRFVRHDRIIGGLMEEGFNSTDIASALIHMIQGGAIPATQDSDTPAAGTEPAAKSEQAPAAQPARSQQAPASTKSTDTPPRPAEPRAPEHRLEPADVPEQEPRHHEPAAAAGAPSPEAPKPRKAKPDKFERKGRTGEPGYTTIRLNVGADFGVSAGEVVGKIAGVTRLPAKIVGAVDIRTEETLVDVAEEHAAVVLAKLVGVRMRGRQLKPVEQR